MPPPPPLRLPSIVFSALYAKSLTAAAHGGCVTVFFFCDPLLYDAPHPGHGPLSSHLVMGGYGTAGGRTREGGLA